MLLRDIIDRNTGVTRNRVTNKHRRDFRRNVRNRARRVSNGGNGG